MANASRGDNRDSIRKFDCRKLFCSEIKYIKKITSRPRLPIISVLCFLLRILLVSEPLSVCFYCGKLVNVLNSHHFPICYFPFGLRFFFFILLVRVLFICSLFVQRFTLFLWMHSIVGTKCEHDCRQNIVNIEAIDSFNSLVCHFGINYHSLIR